MTLEQRLECERRKLHIAKSENNVALAGIIARRVVDLQLAIESGDVLIGRVQMMILELEHIETQLRDDRPEGVRLLRRFVDKISEATQPAMAWEVKKEGKTG